MTREILRPNNLHERCAAASGDNVVKKTAPLIAISAHNSALLQGLRLYLDDSRFAVSTISSHDGDLQSVIAAIQPDILVIEISTHSMDGMKLISSLLNSSSSMQVLVLADYTMQSLVNMVFRAGAAGYLLSVPEQAVMLQALEEILRGNRVLDKNLSYMRTALSSVLSSSWVFV